MIVRSEAYLSSDVQTRVIDLIYDCKLSSSFCFVATAVLPLASLILCVEALSQAFGHGELEGSLKDLKVSWHASAVSHFIFCR